MKIVIPSKKISNLVPCVTTIFRNEPNISHHDIIVVDDGLDPSVTVALPGVIFVKGIKPFVFARNVNIGIAAAEDDVLLLNDDALLMTPGGFSAIDEIAKKTTNVGVMAAATTSAGNPNQGPKSANDLRIEPRMVCFIAVYIPRSTQLLIGTLDERFIHYGFDDDDYCRRCRIAGKLIYIWDGCVVKHGELISTYRGGTHQPLEPNLSIFVEKWGNHKDV